MLRKNDMVIVIAGKEKGKTGKLLSVLRERDRALVEKLNMVKRHQKPTPKLRQGGIIEKEASVHLSNLMFYCPRCSRGVRLGCKVGTEGKRVRICRKCGNEVRHAV